ncbi:MAG: hypothetical protein K2I91_02585, partial [Muribaculaceae bacterium]|nr:hypothetical protein [Muribaculaceae bacterium]
MSDKNKGLYRNQIFTILLLLGAAIIALLVVPRNDHQSYTYELNQPWRYPLLTAEFDTPIMRDSASQHSMRDSIDANFAPFVVRDLSIPEKSIQRLSNALAGESSERTVRLMTQLLAEVYRRGIVDPDVYKS